VRGMAACPFTPIAEYLSGADLRGRVGSPETFYQNHLRPNQGRPAIHGPRSFDQEPDHLTKDLELTPNQREQVRARFDEHHDRIQALFDKNPKLSREALGPQIHAISDETHHQIEALLTNHQKQSANAMQEHIRSGEEGRRPAPSAESK
jgi:hypothetical protein